MAGSDDGVIDMNDWLRGHGFKPVPVDGKRATIRSFADDDYVPPDSGLWRREKLNIGVVTGVLIDVDLDCPEASFLAERLLPRTTMVFGRPSKPRSHWMYVGEGALGSNRMAWTDPSNGSVILEIRGAGHQTVMPGSTHPSGEKIDWAEGWPPSLTTALNSELVRIAKLIAAGVIIIRNWHEGSRNELTKYITGMLCHYGWSDGDIETLMGAVFDYCGDDDPSRIKTVRLTIAKFNDGRPTGGAGKLKDFLDDKVIAVLQQWLGSDKVNAVLEYNERFACLMKGNRFGIACTDVLPGWPVRVTSRTDFLHLTENEWVPNPDPDGKPVSKAKIWLQSPQRRTYSEIEFLPGLEDSGDVFNLWTGWAVKPAKDSNNCEAWLELLRVVVCDNDPVLFRRMLHFFASIIREPMNRAPVAPVLVGVPGAGKSLLVRYFGLILGRAGFVSVSRDESITGQFNAHLAQCLLLQSEEAVYAGDKKQRGIIKDLLTAELREYTPKFFDKTFIKNYMRFIITSNYDQAAPIEVRDRRFLTIFMHERKISKELAARVIAELNNDGPAALFRYLLDLDYDSELLWTEYDDLTRYEQIALNLDPMDAWWHGVLEDDRLVPVGLSWGTQPISDDEHPWPPVVKIGVLHAALLTELKRQGVRYFPTAVQFSLRMRRWLGKTPRVSDRKFANVSGGDETVPKDWQQLSERGPAWVDFPSRDDCRKAFSVYLGHSVEWMMSDEGGAPTDGEKVVPIGRGSGRPATRRRDPGSDDVSY